jgi:hypothetical protein
MVLGERNVASTTVLRPPASLDLASVARVRLNAQGNAEWQILGGPNPRSDVIPLRAGRRVRRFFILLTVRTISVVTDAQNRTSDGVSANRARTKGHSSIVFSTPGRNRVQRF